MKAHISKCLMTVVLIILLALTVVPSAAQEGPAQVGLRPDAPPYALHGPYWVGALEIEGETASYPTKIQVWYPATNPNGNPENLTQSMAFMGSPIFNVGHALYNAAPDLPGAPYPLVLFVHGLYGGRLGSAYLSEHLASQGFIVMSMDFAENGETGYTRDPLFSLYTRPKDVSWEIDYAEQLNSDENGKLTGMFDLDRIAVVGHSYGGYTALVAGGALLDLAGPTSWCVEYPAMPLAPATGGGTLQDRFCSRAQEVAELAGLQRVPEAAWPSWADPRIDAVVSLAPWMPFFGAESAAAITVPTMVMYGSGETVVDSARPLYKPYAYDNLGSATKSLVMFEHGDHMLFACDCSYIPWANTPEMAWVCSDPVWDMGRAHDLINHFTTAFLLAELKGDTEAAAALAPDAVAFPGITYEAQGF